MFESKVKDRYLQWGLTLLLVLVTGFILRGIWKVNIDAFAMFCNTDMYLDTLIAKLMWEQKTLFPDGWIFGNQYYVIATPVLCSLIYGIVGDLNFAMGLASCIMTGLVLSAFVWMIWPCVERKASILLGVLTLLACIVCEKPYYDLMAQLFFVMCSYYACYLALAFFVWGQYIRLKKNDQKTKKKNVCIFAVSAVLSFCAGMHSIRQMIVMIAPMCVIEGICLMWNWWKKNDVMIDSFWYTVLVTLSNIFGILFIKMLKIPQRVIYGSTDLVGGKDEIMANLYHTINVTKEVIGYRVSDEFWITVLSAFSIMIVICAAVQCVREVRRKTSLAEVYLLCALSIGVIVLGKLFTHMELRHTYLFMWFPLISISVVCFFEMCHSRNYVLCALVLVLFSCKSYGLSYGQLEQEMEIYRSRWEESVDTANWMVDEGFDTVYGLWDVASKVAVASNGSVKAACWSSETESDIFYIEPFLIDTKLLDDSGMDRSIYMISLENEDVFLRSAQSRGASVRQLREMPQLGCKLYISTKHLVYSEKP